MPTYKYQCRDCGNSFEQFQKFSDDPLSVCPDCSGTIQRVIQNVGVVFKGSGWYINDSRKSGGESKGESGTSDNAKPGSDESKSKDVAKVSASTEKSVDAPKKESPKPAATAAAD